MLLFDKPSRVTSDIEVDFIVDHDMLTALADLLNCASRNDNNSISNKTLSTISIYLESHLENLESYFIEMTTLAGGSEHYITEGKS